MVRHIAVVVPHTAVVVRHIAFVVRYIAAVFPEDLVSEQALVNAVWSQFCQGCGTVNFKQNKTFNTV